MMKYFRGQIFVKTMTQKRVSRFLLNKLTAEVNGIKFPPTCRMPKHNACHFWPSTKQVKCQTRRKSVQKVLCF